MKKKTFFEDALIYSLVRAAELPVRLLPLGAALGFARGAGFVYGSIAKGRKIARQNLRAALGRGIPSSERRRVVRRQFENLFMNIAELLRAPRLKNESQGRFEIEGEERLRACVDQGRAVVLLTAHFGNWELLNLLAALAGYPITVFARIQKHPRTDAYLNLLRSSQGSQVIHKGASARRMMQALLEKRVVGVLADQDAGKGGVFVPFFGKPASFPRGIVRFARRANAAVIPAFDIRENGVRHRIVCLPEIPLKGETDEEVEDFVMSEFSKALEAQIRRRPELWLWRNRKWKSSPHRACVILSDGKKGHLNQCLAFAERVREKRIEAGFEEKNTDIEILKLEFKNEAFRAGATFLGVLTRGFLPFRNVLLRFALRPDVWKKLDGVWADYVISCGASTEIANLHLARETGARSCFIQKPQVAARHDVVIVPLHDKAGLSENVFETRGALVRKNPEENERQKTRFLAQAGICPQDTRPRIGFLVGGRTPRAPWDAAALSRAAGQLKSLYAEWPFHFFATSSRRSAPETEAFLKKVFADWPGCRKLILVHESNPEGAYPGLLHASDLLVVTADSVAMISEAFATGRPVLAVYPNLVSRLDPKLRSFLQNLESTGRLKMLEAEELGKHIPDFLMRPNLNAPDPDDEVVSRAASRMVFGR